MASTEEARRVKDAHAVATIELLAAADAWGEHVEATRKGATGADVLRLRARVLDACTTYHRAQKAFDAMRPSDGVSPPGLDEATGAGPVAYRARDDGGFTPVLGAILCLGLVVVVFASCLWVLAWCPSCEDHAPGMFSGSWASDLGPAHVETLPDGSQVECRPILYVHNGYAEATGAMKCGIVQAKLDPNLPRGVPS